VPAADEKDRFGEKIHDLEKAREDQWAAERDRELLAKLREKAARETVAQRKKSGRIVFSRILCPLDFSDNSALALKLAAQIGVQNDAIVYLLNVCLSVNVPLSGVVTTPVLGEQTAKEKLREFAAQELAGVRHELIVTTGDPAKKIVEAAKGLAVDLVVMGTHGRRGVPRFFLGSVAEQVLRESACPVMVTRMD
jgi:universal stress protein A